MTTHPNNFLVLLAVVGVVILIIAIMVSGDCDDISMHHHHNANINAGKAQIEAGKSKLNEPRQFEVRVNEADKPYDTTVFPPVLPVFAGGQQGITAQRTRKSQFDPQIVVHPQHKHILISAHHTRSGDTEFTALGVKYSHYAVPIYRSTDGGVSWRRISHITTRPNTNVAFHGDLAYGFGPQPGSYRLYYFGMVFNWANNPTDPDAGYDAVKNTTGWNTFAVFYSDDDGATWSYGVRIDPAAMGMNSPSGPYYPNGVAGQPAEGGVPNLITDLNRHSANAGYVYATYNYQWTTPSGARVGQGSRVVCSRDYGLTWSPSDAVELTIVPATDVFPSGTMLDTDVSRPVFGRLAVGPNGDVYAYSVFQIARRPISTAGAPPVGRVFTRFGLQIVRIQFGMTSAQNIVHPTVDVTSAPGNFGLNPYGAIALNTAYIYSHSIAIDQNTGTIYASHFYYTLTNASPRGIVYLYKSNDQGNTWSTQVIPNRPGYSSITPQVAISPDSERIVLVMQIFPDLPSTAVVLANELKITDAFVYSDDGGLTFSEPISMGPAGGWVANNAPISASQNGQGLRPIRFTFIDKHTGVAIYSDGRNGYPFNEPNNPDLEKRANHGNNDVFATRIEFPEGQKGKNSVVASQRLENSAENTSQSGFDTLNPIYSTTSPLAV